jgi:multiple sugar transport system substrate-binding protein
MQRRNRWLLAGAVAITGILTLAGCGTGFNSSTSTGSSAKLTSSKKPLTILIGSSGPSETTAVTSAVASWSKSSGTSAKVIAASDLPQQLAQGFASGNPADVFYLGNTDLAGYASAGDLLSYGSLLPNKSDFYPSLTKAFTYKNQLYCAPKDFSTLQLVINDSLWKKAGLTKSDIPTTWNQLDSVAKKLTSGGVVGLSMNGQYERIGAFMVEAGGNLMNPTSTKATANSAANVTALTFVKKLLNEGVMKYAASVGEGDGGQAIGAGKAAMTVEGNWVTGELKSDFPNVQYTVAPLPAGPAGKGTLVYTNCWGIAKDSPNQAAALKLVEKLTSESDQLAFSKAFGVLPSIQSAATEWKKENPTLVPFLDGAAYAQGTPASKNSAAVVTDFDSRLATLSTSDPKTILDAVQKNLQATLK